MRKNKRLDNDFKQFMGITDDEEDFFAYLYNREKKYKVAIVILMILVIALLVLK